MNTQPIRRAAAAAVVATVSVASSLSVQAATPAGKIVFSRTTQTPTTAPRSRSLWLLDVGTGKVRALTTDTDSVFDMAVTWAPDGKSLVFERGVQRVRDGQRHTLQVVSTVTNQRPHALIHGTGNFSKPAYGPGGRIAFVSQNSVGQCLSVVDATGRNRRDLFCVSAPTQFAQPKWSADGTRLFVGAGYEEGRLEPVWHAQAYRVDVATGSAKLLSDIVMETQLDLTISPDGARGIYADIVANDMTLVDFTNGAAKVLPTRGHAPLFSPDGKRIAFTGEIYEVGPQTRYYEPLYVMNADGAGVRRITDSRVADHAYTAAQWSRDNVHVLVNRRTYTDSSLTQPLFALRMINADTRALTSLTSGYVEAGAWYEGP
ncbi:WD40-like beta Propeller protein [Lysobacter dokdonensis DS-58]|uniref:WD40-like beta Propeller protein n=1 Tax=Lysobacter dokdonensis DS-58 TaxID=1300345 RepID=A0A0A2WHN8_9GAMM|nr:PD40 domain-containing protein [Lysobacter dokdonensis]KGQ19328.1 WD40-like beta Propeller protein [Lysobacter dokdonensis DS-58]